MISDFGWTPYMTKTNYKITELMKLNGKSKSKLVEPERNLAKQRLENLKQDLEEFLEDPQIGMTIDEWSGRAETYYGIVMSGEGGNRVNGIPGFDYYEECDYLVAEAVTEFGGSTPETTYEFGVHKKLKEFLQKRGASAEWYDAGTVHVYFEEPCQAPKR